MGLVLLALSFATSQQSGHHPADAAQPAVPQPVPERLVTGAPLALLEPLVRRTAADSSVAPRATAASGVTGPRADAPLRLATRQRIHRRPVHARARRSATAATRSAGPWSMRYDQVAAAKLARGRIGVQREYIAARERVAALTGEDSGSVFLARQAGRARAGPMAHGRHGHRTAT